MPHGICRPSLSSAGLDRKDAPCRRRPARAAARAALRPTISATRCMPGQREMIGSRWHPCHHPAAPAVPVRTGSPATATAALCPLDLAAPHSSSGGRRYAAGDMRWRPGPGLCRMTSSSPLASAGCGELYAPVQKSSSSEGCMSRPGARMQNIDQGRCCAKPRSTPLR